MAEDLGPSVGKIRVKITCPTSVVMDLEGESALIPTLLGPRLILPKTAPAFFLLKEGKVVVYRDENTPLIYLISQGVCEVRRDICSIMAWGISDKEVDKNHIQMLLEEAQTTYQKSLSISGKREIKKRIDFYRFILKNKDNDHHYGL